MVLHNDLIEILDRITKELNESNVPTEWYTIENYKGYSQVTGNADDTVYCIESNIGLNPKDPSLTTYAIAQVFWDKHPNLVLSGTISADVNGQPIGDALYSTEIDKNFSEIFLPVIYRGFNSLDPTGQFNGQVVQRYTDTKVLLQDFIPAMLFTMRLMVCCGLTGQLATIAGDFNDFLTRIIAGIIGPFVKGEDIFLYPSTWKKSAILVPTRNRSDPKTPFTMESSTALDKCFSQAMKYLTTS